jgi:ABC-type antimicrobial peptide transport system permease subunit
MNLITLKQALRGLRASKTRTILTIVGIVIGIATVIIVLSAGAGFKSYINAQIEAFGSNTVIIETVVPATTKARQEGTQQDAGTSSASNAVPVTTLKYRDLEAIKLLPNVVDAYGAALGQKIVAYDQTTKNAFIFGSDASRFRIDKGEFAKGRPFTDEENRSLAQVAILGADVAKDLFGEEDPLNKTIRVGELNFTVIGVYTPRGSFGFSNDDQQVFVPITTLQKKLLGIDYLFYAVVQVKDTSLSEYTSLDIGDVLRRNHQITDPNKDDFKVQTQAEGLSTFDTILSAVTFLLLAIAAISLVVGGVGVMNIMYVAVTERTAEIGLKKALGATRKNIANEFLYEAVIVTLLGGVIGILLGAGISFLVALLAQNFGFAWKFSVPLSGVIAGLVVSGAIGYLFGVLPAKNASELDPIEALRKE